MVILFCSNCNNRIDDDAAYCVFCGKKTEGSLDVKSPKSSQTESPSPTPRFNPPSAGPGPSPRQDISSPAPIPSGGKTNPGDIIAAVSGLAMVISFFLPTISFLNLSIHSIVTAGFAEELKYLYIYPIMGAALLVAALILHSCRAYPWLRIIYLVPIGLVIIGLASVYAKISSEAPNMMNDLSNMGISRSTLSLMIDQALAQGGAAIYMLLGGFVGSVIAAVVGIFSKRV